jgi:hypothetical protein
MRSRLALCIIAAVALAACSGGAATTAPTSAPETAAAPASTAPTEAPSMAPSGSPSAAPSASSSTKPLDLGTASGGVSNLDSYQMDISVTSGTETQKLTIQATKTPTDATHYVLAGSQSLEFIEIKDQGAWMKQGGTWTPVPAAATAMLSVFDALAPDKLISAYGLGKFGKDFAYVDMKDHNGVQAAHYHLDAGLASQLGATGFPTDGTFDAWVAVDGGYLVGMQFSGTDPSSGDHVDMTIDVSHVNDPGLVIEAPTGG